jgi:hypothetical protein
LSQSRRLHIFNEPATHRFCGLAERPLCAWSSLIAGGTGFSDPQLQLSNACHRQKIPYLCKSYPASSPSDTSTTPPKRPAHIKSSPPNPEQGCWRRGERALLSPGPASLPRISCVRPSPGGFIKRCRQRCVSPAAAPSRSVGDRLLAVMKRPISRFYL